jgi:hypothetical protein
VSGTAVDVTWIDGGFVADEVDHGHCAQRVPCDHDLVWIDCSIVEHLGDDERNVSRSGSLVGDVAATGRQLVREWERWRDDIAAWATASSSLSYVRGLAPKPCANTTSENSPGTFGWRISVGRVRVGSCCDRLVLGVILVVSTNVSPCISSDRTRARTHAPSFVRRR